MYLGASFWYDVSLAPVAQLDRVQVSETWGQWFESTRAHKLYSDFHSSQGACHEQ
jgi:hypothetical protein